METGGKQPPARAYHSACCVSGEHPLLMVVGGWGKDYKSLSDAWLFDVDRKSWKEVCDSGGLKFFRTIIY